MDASDGSTAETGADGGAVYDSIHCPAGGVLFEKLGLVHAPTVGNEYHRETFKPPAGVYADVRLQLDVFAPGWNDPTTSMRYLLFWFARNGKHLDLFGYAALVAKHSVLLRHGIGITAGNKPKLTTSATLPMPETYHVAYRYDMAGGVALLDLTRGPNRTPVAQLKGVPNVSNISIAANGTVDVDLGNQGPNDPISEPPGAAAVRLEVREPPRVPHPPVSSRARPRGAQALRAPASKRAWNTVSPSRTRRSSKPIASGSARSCQVSMRRRSPDWFSRRYPTHSLPGTARASG